jgi:ABC-type lipopolysaccharide export system ATPase subunit
VADVVSFMHDGRIVVTGTFDEVRKDPVVRSIYIGEGGFEDGVAAATDAESASA